jgi:GDP-4-dehydro-6-deoxy-D-mannose reductase
MTPQPIHRVLLTGAGGLIGRELWPALVAAGYEVFPASRSEFPGGAPASAEAPAGFASGDLADPAVCRELLLRLQPDAVVHLAGGARGGRRELYRSNVLTTVHLLEEADGLASAPYFVVFGSAAEYGASEGPIAEGAPLCPLTEYGRAKAAQTALAEAIAEERRLSLTVVRPFNVVAPELPPSSALGNMREQLLASSTGVSEPRRVICGRLDVVRDFVPVDAVVEGVLALLRSPAPGATINLCSGVGLDLESILRAMARRAGVDLEIVIDEALARLPAAPSVIGDPTLMRELLGVSPAPTADSLARVLLP